MTRLQRVRKLHSRLGMAHGRYRMTVAVPAVVGLLICVSVLQHNQARSRPDSQKPHLVFVHYSFPELRYGSDLRLLELMRLARADGYPVSFLCRSRGNKINLDALEGVVGADWHVSHIRWLTRWHPLVRKCRSANVPIAVLIPIWFWEGLQLTIFEQFGPVLRSLLPNATLVAISDDCHSKREELLGTVLRADERPEFYITQMPSPQWFREKERAIFSSADLVTFISAADAQACDDLVPSNVTRALLRTSPRRDVTPPEKVVHEGLVFLGNGLNPTNAASIRQFLLHVWPLFRREMPHMRLVLVGQDSKAAIPCVRHRKLCGWTWQTDFYGAEAENNIIISSFMPSLSELLRARLAMVVPIAVTTGVNTKLFEAFQYGLPVITTQLPLRALELQGGNCCSVCELYDAHCWLGAARDLQNEKSWTAASAASLRAGHELYAAAAEKNDLARLLHSV